MKRILAAGLLVVVAATGCGGSSNKKSALAAPSPSSSAPGLPSALPTSLSRSLAGLASAECQQVALTFSQASSAFSATSANAPLSDRFAAVRDALAAAADKIDKADVKVAVKTLSKAYGDFANGLKGVNYTPGNGSPPPAAYLAAIQAAGSPQIAAATKVLRTYFTSGCK
jgi:hypothetical protein